MKSDIQIAQETKLKNILEIAKTLNIDENDIEYYGKYKAKLDLNLFNKHNKKAKLVLVTAINPTPFGEGKTTTSIGLADALSKLGVSTCLALREPSLGPVFGLKGGATGGGYAQVAPMEDINLHFTGDFHAISSAHNLISAMLDNHIFQGNELNIDINKIVWKRVVDMNDRQLRFIKDGLGGVKNGVERNDGYDITVASEIMAVFCLSNNIKELKENIGNIIIAYDKNDKPITVKMIKADGAAAALLKDAIKPNLVQTLEGTPAIIHGGPFANIAHGANSIIATNLAKKISDIVVTEAGFGADLGAEKFMDITSRKGGFNPDTVVIVATVRALKFHGGVKKEDLTREDLNALKNGVENLTKHIDSIKNVYNVPCVVAINKFTFDTDSEIKLIEEECNKLGANVVLSDVWARGGDGGIDLAKKVIELTKEKNSFTYAYELNEKVEDKIEKIVKKVYGGSGVVYTDEAKEDLRYIYKLNMDKLPICMAKTQYSLSDNKDFLGAPKDFNITIRKLKISSGAGFIVALTGDILTMPGLPKVPAAENIDVDDKGVISGLF